MKRYIKCGDYLAWYEWIKEDNEYHGRMLGVEAIIGLYGKTLEELSEDFKNAIEEYESDFKMKGKKPLNLIREALII